MARNKEVEMEEVDEELLDDETEEEEIEPDEEDVEQEGDDDEESDDEDFELEFNDGTKMTASEVVAMKKELEALKAKDAEYNNLVNVVNQYEGEINKNELLRDVLYYIREGKHSNKQIARGIGLLDKYKDEQEQTTFETIEEEVNYKVNKAINKVVTPLQNEILQLKQYQIQAETQPYNSRILWETSKDSISQEEFQSPEFIDLMIEANNKFNDGADLKTTLLDKRAAAAMVNYALLKYKKQPMKKKVVASSKAAAELPKRIPSNAGGKGTKGAGERKMSPSQKINEWNSL